MTRRWNHLHSLATGVAGGILVVSGHPWIVILAFGLAFAAGAAVALAGVGSVRFLRRVDRALPDSSRHPCGQCSHPVTGRNKYCSETCRELAADERAARRRVMQRMEEYGEVPF